MACPENVMRYYFHLVRGSSAYKDNRGLEFPDAEGAIAEAQAMARKRAADDLWHQWSVLVIDADQKVVLELPIIRETAPA